MQKSKALSALLQTRSGKETRAPLLSSDVKINCVVSMLSARETESVQYHLEGFAADKESCRERQACTLPRLQAGSSLCYLVSRMCLHPGLMLWTFVYECEDSVHQKVTRQGSDSSPAPQ
ncbi:Formimidoyltransferase-Cyclodeaminase [Manis pentadactyla]|nr:Formimidoyltransferase-Cyclodeaminase [Manis pentadactyla]